jgi:ATP/maltotriose-dependent transcriptional regulator MalT
MILLLKTERRRQSGATHASEVHGRLARGLEAAPTTVPSRALLTERELDVLELLEARLSNWEIASCLAISQPAVEWHAANVCRKLRLSNRSPAVREALTPHELAVLRLLVGRLTIREMAHKLDVSPFTIKRHTISLYQKLQVQNGRQAVARARTLGFLPVGSGVEERPGTRPTATPVYLLRPKEMQDQRS